MSISNDDQSSEMDRSVLLAGADGSYIPAGENKGGQTLQRAFFLG